MGLITVLFLSIFVFLTHPSASTGKNIRKPYAAGTFYPSDPAELKAMLEMMETEASSLNQKETRQEDGPMILILPHAGYPYSGSLATQGYDLVKARPIKTVIIIGPYHKDMFEGVSLWSKGAFETPLGQVPIDEEFSASLQRGLKKAKATATQLQKLHEQEHSVEVHVPFVQFFFPAAKIVPILIRDFGAAKKLAHILAPLVRGRSDVLVIASTDMSHYYKQETANRIDAHTLELFESKNIPALEDALKEKKSAELCGDAATISVFTLASILGCDAYSFVRHATSGDITGEYDRVVGYSTSALFETSPYTEKQGRVLLDTAWKTLKKYLKKGEIPQIHVDAPQLNRMAATFVTLRTKDGVLRGCIGQLSPSEPLVSSVVHMTIAAATKDARFPPVQLSEIDHLSLEISILSPPQKVSSADDIIFGKHGVILSQGNHRGVFLPDVAENFQTKEEFLSELCTQKAGLDEKCWISPETTIEVFTTHIIR